MAEEKKKKKKDDKKTKAFYDWATTGILLLPKYVWNYFSSHGLELEKKYVFLFRHIEYRLLKVSGERHNYSFLEREATFNILQPFKDVEKVESDWKLCVRCSFSV